MSADAPMSVFAAGGNATSSALVAMDDDLEDANARNRALAVARGGGGGSGSRGGSGGGASMTRASALWSMTQVYAVLLLAVWGYNCAATTLRATRTDLSPEGMMLAGGVDPSVIARYNASTYGRGYGSIDRSYDEIARWKHATRYTIRGSFNAAAGVSKGVARAATSSAKWGFRMAISAMERAGMGPVIDVCSMMSVATTSSIGNMMWLVTFAISPIAEYALMPIYDFVLDGLEPLYLYFVTGTMDFFEDMTFTLEQNLATVLDEKVLSVIRWPLHIFLNPFKWPQGFYEAVLYPTYRFCAYPELFDMKEQPVPPIVKRTYGESCRSNAWGEWTKCSVQCGVGFKARVNHCGRRQFNRCVGSGVIGCDGVCESGLRVDCNGSCGGKALLDKCGICGGNNAALGCDGKCFSGMREDTVGNCCHSASITASGVCGSGENLPAHLRAAAEAARAKAEASKNKPPLMRRIYQKMRPALLIVFNISMTALRLLSLVVHVMVRTSSFVIGTLFSTLTLKIIGSLTAGYMIVGVVDKKLQKNIGSFVREAVPFMDEKPREQEKDKSPAHAYLYDEKPKTKKEIIEDWVLAGVARLKRGSEVPGSVANYVMWLIGKLNAFVVYASPFVLRVMRDASYVEVSRARQQAKLAEREKRTMHRQHAILAQKVEEEVRTEEERQLIMQEAEDAREKAVNTERRAAELAARNEAELVRTATEEAATKARLEAEEASAKAQVAAEEERVRREEAEAKARLEAEDSERRARVAAEKERVHREEAETKAALEALITAEEERVRKEEAEAKARLEEEEAERKAIIAAEEERVRKEEAEAKARIEAEEVELKARREEEEAALRRRLEAEEAELKARREEEERAIAALREEEEQAIAALHEEEERTKSRLLDEQERLDAEDDAVRARLEQEKAERQRRLEAEEAEIKARIEAEEAKTRERLEAEQAERKARLEQEEAEYKQRLEMEEAELQGRLEEETKAKSRPEAVTLSHVDQLMQRTEAAKKVMLETKSRLDPQSEVIKQFEGANVGKKNALKKKSALESVQVHSSVLSEYFVAKSRHTLLEEELVSAVKHRDLSDEKNVDDAIRARLREAEPLPEAIRDKFSFLLKYRARRNVIVALSKLSVNHPDGIMRRRCFRSLNKITRASKFGLLVVARCEALPNALSMLNDWSVTTTTDENAPWEAFELIHNLVSSRQMRASVSLMRQLEGDTFARCLLSILKTVPHLPAVQGMGLATLWQIVRSSGYDTALQNTLIEDGVIRHLMENREYAKQNSALARVVIGCALSIAMDNANAQKQMTDKRNALPKRIVRILGIHGDIDYKGEFKPLNEWLMNNA